MRSIVFMRAVERRNAIKKWLDKMYNEHIGAKIPIMFHKGYRIGYLDALLHNNLINDKQYDILRKYKCNKGV